MAGSMDDSTSEEQFTTSRALRDVMGFFEKYERYDSQELLAYAATHWMLSTEDFKLPTEPATGIISHMFPISSNTCFFLVPEEQDIPPLDYREIHQIVQELTYGIYALNQLPFISLEANFDQSTSCQLPLAYQDTRVGQIMINVDYMMKALWHGAYFPREKRTKFSERWRSNLDVNSNGKPETKKPLLTEFTSAGMIDVSKDPDYVTAYDNLPEEQPGDLEMAEERRYFMSNVDVVTMLMTIYQRTIKQHNNMFVLNSDWLISSIVKATEDKIDAVGYERINARLQLHEIMLKDHLCSKKEVKRQMQLLKLVSFLVPFLVGQRKRMKIPDIERVLPKMTSDDVRTERELPPLMLGPDYKCSNFNFGSHYFHLHGGIQFELETCNPEKAPQKIVDAYEKLRLEATKYLAKILDPDAPLQESYPVPVEEIDGIRYHVVALEFETFYPQAPQKPKWVHSINEELHKLRPKRLPLTDIQIHEQFKKYFGYKKAIKYKNLPNGLKAAAIRGLVSMFSTLCRKCPASRLGKPDEVGLSLIHYAAMYNRPQIMAHLILQSMDVNVKRNNNFLPTGPTPLHLAARFGALDAVSCLLANCASLLITDQDGWAPIHYAAYYDNVPVIKLFIRKNDTLLELQTRNDSKSSPLLLAASSGALCAVMTLIEMGAHVLRKDDAGNNVIHLAAMHFHTNVLEYFIQWDKPDVPVWQLLVEMLGLPNEKKKEAAVKCLEVMSGSDPGYWTNILEAGGIPALVELLKLNNEEIQAVAASVMCNISEHEPVRNALTEADASSILIQLLSSPVDDIQARAAIVLSDLACVSDNQTSIAAKGGIPPLVHLLDSELEDVLVNAVNAIRVLCISNPDNQVAVAENGGLEPLVEFLSVDSDILQAAAAAAIAAVTAGNHENQDAVVAEGAVKPIVALIKGKHRAVRVKAASALEALADNNLESQKAFLDLDAPTALIRLLKVWELEVKEQGACALWALAGVTKAQQRYIAERIGIPALIEMLLLSSEKLQYVGCMAVSALGKENMESQNKIANDNGIEPLVRLLRSPKTTEKVLLAVIKVLGTLCVGVAHRNNKVTQKKIAEENGITHLVDVLLNPPTPEIQVEVANTLGCVVLCFAPNQEKLREETPFRFTLLLDLLDDPDEIIRLKAGMALSIFAFNNTPQQYAIREAGGIPYESFEPFLESDNEYFQCYAAFQMVVLARVIVDADQVSLTAQGVTLLVNLLSSEDDQTVILTASLMSSLAHTRAGITDAMFTMGAIEALIEKLHSKNEQVRFSCAIALGYMTFNRTAMRQLLIACRNTPKLYDRIMSNIGESPRISKEFTSEFERQKIIGLPCLSLEINGGPPAVPPKRQHGRRPHTTMGGYREQQDSQTIRATSAPAAVLRSKSATSLRSRPSTQQDSRRTEKISVDDIQFKNQRNRPRSTALKSKLSSWK